MVQCIRNPARAAGPAYLLCTFLIISLGGWIALASSQQPTSLGQTIMVPFDYHAPDLGAGSLYFEFGAPFDSSKPLVLIIADAQQYYVRRGAMADIQNTLFGDAFNVVGIVGRSTSEEFLKSTLAADRQVDWIKAWRIFNSDQWIADIDAVRRAFLGTGLASEGFRDALKAAEPLRWTER